MVVVAVLALVLVVLRVDERAYRCDELKSVAQPPTRSERQYIDCQPQRQQEGFLGYLWHPSSGLSYQHHFMTYRLPICILVNVTILHKRYTFANFLFRC